MRAGAPAERSESLLVPWVHCRVQAEGFIPQLVQPPTTVAVMSEDRMLREVLEASLAAREGLQVLAEGPEGNGAVDVVVIDAGFNPVSALARTWEAPERWPGAKVIAVGFEREDETLLDFIEAGAGGYVLKGSSPEDLVAVIRAAQQGLVTCSPRVIASVLERISALSRRVDPAPPPSDLEPLTVREREILGLLATGLGNKEVGRRLRITVQTVKNHVHRILEKLQVHRRRDAVRLAYDVGILAEPREIPPSGRVEPGNGEANGLDPF
jgi:DNA-binding NarL/FixJ family response regulator